MEDFQKGRSMMLVNSTKAGWERRKEEAYQSIKKKKKQVKIY